MSVSPVLSNFLHKNQVSFDVLEHNRTRCALDTANASRVSPDRLAKAVVVRHGGHFCMCVVPASHHLILEWLEYELQLPYEIATENDLIRLFPDCDRGAIPCIGQAYDLSVVLDTALMDKKDIYMEGGDHQHLVHIQRKDFEGLMGDAWQAVVSCPIMEEFNQTLH
jgi:Ala-tRNA(Pro) deacylase